MPNPYQPPRETNELASTPSRQNWRAFVKDTLLLFATAILVAFTIACSAIVLFLASGGGRPHAD